MDIDFAMKKLLLIAFFLLLPSAAFAQCTGAFPPTTFCGNTTFGNGPPKPIPYGGVGSPFVALGSNFYADASAGSDSNDCLAASTTGTHGPCLTLQHLVVVATTYAAPNGTNFNYQFLHLAGTFTTGLLIAGPPMGAGALFSAGWVIDGGGTAIIDDNTSNCGSIIGSVGANVLVQNITVRKTTGCGSAGSALYFQQNSILRTGVGVTLGPTTGAKITLEGSYAELINNFTITGNSAGLISSGNTSFALIDSVTITCSGAATYTNAFWIASTLSGIYNNATFSGCGSITGPRLAETTASLVWDINGIAGIPGNSNGSVSSGASFFPPPQPTLGVCTNGAIQSGSTDQAIGISFSGASSSCTVNFAIPYSGNGPICTSSANAGTTQTGTTNTFVTIQGSFANTITAYILCKSLP